MVKIVSPNLTKPKLTKPRYQSQIDQANMSNLVEHVSLRKELFKKVLVFLDLASSQDRDATYAVDPCIDTHRLID
jgi:hypothetical protein